MARRIGPVVAAVGLLVAVAVLAWVAVAPDNVVGTVAEAGLDVPAVAAVAVDEDGCVELVHGDATTSQVCADISSARVFEGSQPWWAGDRLVIDTSDGPYEIDPATGAVVSSDVDDVDRRWQDERFREDVWVDRDVVRLGGWGDEDGEVVLDLGGPVRTLRDATLSPDGDWVAATDEQDRVLVASTDAPDEVHVWFELEEDGWFDVWGQVRWDG